MDYIITKNGILLKNAKDFEPRHVFECGQCFRWKEMQDGGYSGIAGGRALRVKRAGNDILLEGTDERDFHEYWVHYFDLSRDYGAIKEILSKDPVLESAMEYGSGIRILKQDAWETLVSFIISANNRIPRIMSTIERLCQSFGEKRRQGGAIYFDFPSPYRLAALEEQDLRACGCGFRAKYLLKAARIVSEGRADLYSLEKLSTDEARDDLLCFSGVGPKVADCVMLFSMAKFDAFPVDVWVKRVMEHYYLKEETPLSQIRRFAADRFGPFAGIAQQYLFYYARGTMGGTPGGG